MSEDDRPIGDRLRDGLPMPPLTTAEENEADRLMMDAAAAIERRDRTIAQYQNALQAAAAEIERLRAAVSAHCAASRPYLVATSELWDVLDG